MTSLEMVQEFHEAFGCPVDDGMFTNYEDKQLADLRLGLIEEETRELATALFHRDKTQILDALCDLQYVLDGAFLVYGLHSVKDQAMEEVHRSNMSKLGDDGKPVRREDGKILKGPNYTPPNLVQFV